MDTLAYIRETATSLSHATLIIGASREQQTEFIGALAISPHDTVILQGLEEGGIKAVRGFASQLLLSPQFGTIRLGIIYDTDTLTLQAQNALLKLLEEPPPRVKLILFAQREGNILTTIISRCRKYYASHKAVAPGTLLLSDDRVADFTGAESLAKQDDLIVQTEGWLHTVYRKWRSDGYPNEQLDTVLRYWEVYQKSTTQINKRLILEQLVVSSL